MSSMFSARGGLAGGAAAEPGPALTDSAQAGAGRQR